eukprot:3962842-Amphidinium_carterae.1
MQLAFINSSSSSKLLTPPQTNRIEFPQKLYVDGKTNAMASEKAIGAIVGVKLVVIDADSHAMRTSKCAAGPPTGISRVLCFRSKHSAFGRTRSTDTRSGLNRRPRQRQGNCANAYHFCT